jgi:hypothetical protein
MDVVEGRLDNRGKRKVREGSQDCLYSCRVLEEKVGGQSAR